MSNNPPFCSLDLTQEEAEFLLRHCNASLKLSLGFMMGLKDRATAERLVKNTEQYKSIRAKLLIGGTKEVEDD